MTSLRWLAVAMVLASGPAAAQSGFYLPTPAPSPGQDEFRASDGTTCRTTMDGTKRMEVGTFATAQRGDNRYALPSYLPEASQGNLGAYGRFTWSLDASPSRMDCHELYQLEIEKKKLELEMLKQSIRSAEQKLEAVQTQPVKRKPGSGRAPPP
jgi:hypothetical protein